MSSSNKKLQYFTPPRYQIDLSLPPRARYKTLATEYKTQLRSLTVLFDQLLLDLTLPSAWLPTVNRCSRWLLRKLQDPEQTEELRGIAEVTDIPMYLLIAFNVVLDLLMGCTSGAARSLEPGQPQTQSKMLHFRTLDWTMNPLRRFVVQLDFVKSQSPHPSTVIASSITYVGFTGVLTGVRQGLSISLNFRAVHNAAKRSDHFKFYLHHVLVLLGRRQSIAGWLRHYLLDKPGPICQPSYTPASIASDLPARHTTAAYIILSDGNNTLTLEKDYDTAKIRQSSSFIAITNHDKDEDEGNQHPIPAGVTSKNATVRQAGLQELIEESTERLYCIQQKWNTRMTRARKDFRKSRKMQVANKDVVNDVYVTKLDLCRWLCDWPTTNECTHFAAILDPIEGNVAWCRAYPEPVQAPSTDD